MTNTVPLKDVVFFLLQQRDDDKLYGHHERHGVVYQLLMEFRAPVSLYDQVMDQYLEHIRKKKGFLSAPMKAIQRAYSLRNNASAAKTEELLKEVIRFGWHRYAIGLAEALNRTLTPDEVLTLVDVYENGCSRCDQDEEDLLDLATNIGDESLIKQTREAFTRQKKRDALNWF